MRILLCVACLCLFTSINAQKRNKRNTKEFNTSSVILSQLSKSLYTYDIAATSSEKQTGLFRWNFLLCEENLKRKVSKDLAMQMTAFAFTFQPHTNRYKGEILRVRKGVKKTEVLGTIYKQLISNARKMGSDLDFIRIDGEYYYLLYFPNEPKIIN